MKKEELINEIGKKRFLSNENSLIAALNYESGINEFDKELNGKTQKEKGFVIHIIEHPKGLLIKLAKNFSSVKFGINFNEIEKLIVSTNNAESLFILETKNNKIIFKIIKQSIGNLKEFIGESNLNLEFNNESVNIDTNYLTSNHNAIEAATKFVEKQYKIGLWASLFFFILTILIKKMEIGKDYLLQEGSTELPLNTALFWAFLATSIICLYISLGQLSKQRAKVQNILKDEYFLWFKYKNGDELIIADKVIIPFSKIIKTVERKIDGFSWDLDNLKYGLKDLSEGDLPISLIIPNISISTNKLPAIIPFGMRDNEFLMYFIDTIKIKSLLLIINNKKPKSETFLNYPISDEITFTKEDFELLSRRISKNNSNRFGSLYVNEIFLKTITKI